MRRFRSPPSKPSKGGPIRRTPSRRRDKGRTNPGYDRSLPGPIALVEPGRNAVFPTLGRQKRSFYAQTSVDGNFIDPNSHTWMKLNTQFPNGHVCLDFDTPFYSHWKLFHDYYTGSWYSMNDTGPYVNGLASEAAFAGEVKNLAEKITMRKFYKSLRDSENQFAVDVAEARKSYGMIAYRLKQIVDIAKKVRRRAFTISRRNPNDPNKAPWAIISKLWLEYKYGWSPLVSSAFGIAQYVRGKSKNGKFRIYETTMQRRIKYFKRVNGLGFVGFTEQNASTYCKISADYQVDCAWLNNASRFFGLNPVSIVWELVPYSFVADWFVDIGGYLQDYETALGLGLQFKRGYTTTMHSVLNRVNIPAADKTIGGRRFVNYTNVEFYEAWRHMQRTRLYGTPFPALPTWDPKLGASRIASGAALLLNLLTKFNPRNRFDDKIRFDPWGPGWKYL